MKRAHAIRALSALGVAMLCGTSGHAQTSVAGTLNPATGVFTVAPRVAKALPPEAEPYAAATVGGTFRFIFAITIKSTIPTAQKIVCSATLSVRDSDFSSEVAYYETKGALATRTGTTATCAVGIPYSWLLPDVATSVVGLNYNVSTGGLLETDLIQRTHNGTMNSVTVPLNGAVTTKNIKVTL